jgi:hypothetical protein
LDLDSDRTKRLDLNEPKRNCNAKSSQKLGAKTTELRCLKGSGQVKKQSKRDGERERESEGEDSEILMHELN